MNSLRYILVVNRRRCDAVVAFPWNKPPTELRQAVDNPQCYFNAEVTRALNYEPNRDELIFYQFTDKHAFERGSKLVAKGTSLDAFETMITPIGYRRGEITPGVVESVKSEHRSGYSQRQIAENNRIALGSVNAILRGQYDEKRTERGCTVRKTGPQKARKHGVQKGKNRPTDTQARVS